MSHSGLPQGFLHFSSTALAPIYDSELYHIGQWSNNLLQSGQVKDKATDHCCPDDPDSAAPCNAVTIPPWNGCGQWTSGDPAAGWNKRPEALWIAAVNSGLLKLPLYAARNLTNPNRNGNPLKKPLTAARWCNIFISWFTFS